ncbi:putative defense protein 3 [Anneissia japonica]|uniref:putative defense protein 3 n=1 Tax=Anneissia japonica TaxID=1529436 RepID=UPI001425A2AA|nr:putative defense protein 3 [Anneissia japonica]
MWKYVVLIIWLDISQVNGYSTGAVSSVCNTLLPGHGVSSQPVTTNPYTITTDVQTFHAGSFVNFTIAGADFKGFMLQVDGFSDSAYGEFVSIPGGTKLLNCGTRSSNAVTHSNSNTKTSVTLKWQAPLENLEGHALSAVATIVQQRLTFWVRLQSSLIRGVPVPVCSLNCQNSGSCIFDSSGNEICDCVPGFAGPTCKRSVVYCPCEIPV